MTEARWARITELFHRAIERPAGTERAVWLNETCGEDLTLLRNVQRLLDAHDQPSLASPTTRLEAAALELAPGEMLAHYRVEGKIGQGGMGMVYRATDTRLRRTVALKVLLPFYAASDVRQHRLLREARAAASLLNHPNVVTIHEVGTDQDLDFIAMEHIDGVSLQARIGEQGMPVPLLVRYATQIADALATAHAAHVLHRDIKPSNIMVTRDDRIKVLDFGLARVMESDDPSVAVPAAADQTETGLEFVRGTPAYMSPEQASGRKLDARSDIFSLGCVLYQMATARRPFVADSNLSAMYRIVNEPPPAPTEIVALPADLEALILRCLEKDPARRFQSMDELKAALSALDPGARPKRSNPVVRRLVRRMLTAGLAAALLGLAGWAVWRVSRASNPAGPRRTVKFGFTPANLLRGGTGEVDSEVSISPDGTRIAYVESQGGQLWTREINREQAQPVPGAKGVYQAFWSPDGQWIGYSFGNLCGIRPGCDLVKIPVAGGAPQTIVRMAGSFKRAFWSSDGKTIVYCDSTGMYTVPAEGNGAATRLVAHTHIEHPSFLDLPGGGQAVLFQALDAEQPSHAIYVQVMGENTRRLLKVSESTNPYPTWSPTGHVIYVDGPNSKPSIWALPFSLATLRPTGEAFQIVESGSAPMMSATGTLVYGDPPSNRFQLSWVDRSGKTLTTLGEPQTQGMPVLSPDGRRAAVVMRESGWDLSVYDTSRGTATPLTSDRNMETAGSWTPSGNEYTYVSGTTREWTVMSRRPGPDAEPKRWFTRPAGISNPVWSPDSRFLLYTAVTPGSKRDLVYRECSRGGAAGELGDQERPFVRTAANEQDARFSSDGRWVAYSSDESGQFEVYVRAFPDEPQQSRRVSTQGGAWPRWRHDGRELFYTAGGKLMAATVNGGVTTSPVLLFERRGVGQLQFDAAADGKRFLILERPAGERPLAVHVVHEWFEEFRAAR